MILESIQQCKFRHLPNTGGAIKGGTGQQGATGGPGQGADGFGVGKEGVKEGKGVGPDFYGFVRAGGGEEGVGRGWLPCKAPDSVIVSL